LDRVGKLNAGWLRLATVCGVLNHEREFLLEVDYALEGEDWPQLAWIKVQLLDDWSIADGTVDALGGFAAPEFTALSVDGQALMRTTLWGNGSISSLVIPEPSVAMPIRRFAEEMATGPRYSRAVQEAARVWLRFEQHANPPTNSKVARS
jgi:hypothetical protein